MKNYRVCYQVTGGGLPFPLNGIHTHKYRSTQEAIGAVFERWGGCSVTILKAGKYRGPIETIASGGREPAVAAQGRSA